jgi:predicted Zn-dependent protease
METPRMLASAWRDAPLLALRMTAIAACMLAAGLAFDARAQSTKPAGQASTPATSASQQATFSKEELAQLVAPVALYPDSLLAQVLMASTYPGDVADAAKWSKAHPDAKGDAR